MCGRGVRRSVGGGGRQGGAAVAGGHAAVEMAGGGGAAVKEACRRWTPQCTTKTSNRVLNPRVWGWSLDAVYKSLKLRTLTSLLVQNYLMFIFCQGSP